MFALIQPIAAEFILFFGGCLVLLMDAFKAQQRRVLFLGLIVILLASVAAYSFHIEGAFYSGMFVSNAYTVLIKVFLLLVAAGFIFSTANFLDKYSFHPGEYLVMLMFMLVGILLMISAQHFMMLYIGMEVQALSAYTLASMQRRSSFASEAGVKYFILGSLASVFYLLGVSLLYGASGTLAFSDLGTMVAGSSLSHWAVGVVLVIVSLLFKLSVVPFHLWAPDVYQGAPTPSTAVFSSIVKVGGVVVLIRLLSGPFALLQQVIDLKLVLLCGAVLSLLWGAVVPIFQTSIKRLLTHAGVGHVGFVLLGLSYAKADGLAATSLYILTYCVTAIMVFIALISLQNKQGSEDELDDISLNSLKGIANIRPKHAFVLAVGFLSMAGVPPLIGFFPKLLILQHVLQQESYIALAVVVITTAVSLFYYLKIIKVMYIDDVSPHIIQPVNKMRGRLFLVFLPLLLLHIVGGYVPWIQNFYEHSITKGVNALVQDQAK